MTGLHVAEGVDLPLEFITSSNGILDKKGAGKTSAAVVLFEEMHKVGVPVVTVDPKGDWYGIRASATGDEPGLPIPVLGGRHGDVALDPTAGELVADLLVDEKLSAILDVSEFTKAELRRFLRAFGDRFYRRAERSASVNKDALTQIDNLFVLRTTAPQDRDAVKAWIDVHADSKSILAELPTLQTGECWLWQPERGEPIKFRFRRRYTFDAGTTPQIGEIATAPTRTTLADVDLGAIVAAITPQQTTDTRDNAQLRADNARLRRELAAATSSPPREKFVEVPVPAPVDPAVADAIRRAIADLTSALDQLAVAPAPTRTPPTDAPTTEVQAPTRAEPAPARSTSRSELPTLRSGAHRMVLTLGRMAPLRLTKSQWGTVARLKTSSGTWSTYLSDIRRAGFLDESPAGYTLTDAGFEYLGGRPTPLAPMSSKDHYRFVLRRGAAAMLDALIDAYTRSLSKEEIGAAADIAITGGTFSTYLSDLTRNGLAHKTPTGLVAADILMNPTATSTSRE